MKHLLIPFASLLASAALAASSQSATAPSGVDNIAFGYGAGYMASGTSTNVIAIGTDAAAHSSNNSDCIFIGANAGANMSGKTGAVVIGDVLVHTNGVTTIKGLDIPEPTPTPATTNLFVEAITNSVGDIVFKEIAEGYYGNPWLMVVGNYYQGGTSTYGFGARSVSCGDLFFNNQDPSVPTCGIYLNLFYESTKTIIDTDYIQSDYPAFTDPNVNIRKKSQGGAPYPVRLYYRRTDNDRHEFAMGDDGMRFSFENGQLCVYTNDVKAGTLTFTPVSQ